MRYHLCLGQPCHILVILCSALAFGFQLSPNELKPFVSRGNIRVAEGELSLNCYFQHFRINKFRFRQISSRFLTIDFWPMKYRMNHTVYGAVSETRMMAILKLPITDKLRSRLFHQTVGDWLLTIFLSESIPRTVH